MAVALTLCWADAPELYRIVFGAGGFEETIQCDDIATDCSLGLCAKHCREILGGAHEHDRARAGQLAARGRSHSRA